MLLCALIFTEGEGASPSNEHAACSYPAQEERHG